MIIFSVYESVGNVQSRIFNKWPASSFDFIVGGGRKRTGAASELGHS